MSGALPTVTLRAARPDEAGLIAGHRRAMFEEMSHLPKAQLEALEAASASWVAERMTQGVYLGWFAVDGVSVVGGAGLWIMDWPPHRLHLEPRRGYILNVYVAPAYRRRGLARALTQQAIDWCRANGVRLVTLHASRVGRPVYEGMGFTPTNEMSLALPAEPPSA